MRKLTLIVTFLAIIAFGTAVSFLFTKFNSDEPIIIPQPSTTYVSPTQIKTQTPTPTAFCGQDHLSGTLSSEGAAGNIYLKLELTNTGKTSCEVVLGNSVTALFDAKNIVLHYKQSVNSVTFVLVPGVKVYSQIHYPNGPQCQSGITLKQINFAYEPGLSLISFVPDKQTGKLMIQACSSASEKTTIDIWPLSKNPITP